jgi:hypothetical protein
LSSKSMSGLVVRTSALGIVPRAARYANVHCAGRTGVTSHG